MEKIFDPKIANKLAKGYELKVELKRHKLKGLSLYAKKPIKKGSIIAYYRFKVFNANKYKPYKGSMYAMSVYSKSDRNRSSLIGDVYPGSMDKPKYNIPFWAYFSNEPNGNQEENAYLDTNLKQNYRKRRSVKAGDTMVYKLRADRNIKAGEEIVWCYGSSYGREYDANCDD